MNNMKINCIMYTPQLATVVTLSTLPNSFAKHRVIRGHHQLSHLPTNKFSQLLKKGKREQTCSALSHSHYCPVQGPFDDLVFEELLKSSRNLFVSVLGDCLLFELGWKLTAVGYSQLLEDCTQLLEDCILLLGDCNQFLENCCLFWWACNQAAKD